MKGSRQRLTYWVSVSYDSGLVLTKAENWRGAQGPQGVGLDGVEGFQLVYRSGEIILSSPATNHMEN